MKLSILFIALAIFLSSCTTTRIVGHRYNRQQSDTMSYEGVNKKIKDKGVDVFLKDGSRCSAIIVRIAEDSTHILAEKDRRLNVIATQNIDRIIWRDHFGGVMDGIFCGAPSGACLGSLLALEGQTELARAYLGMFGAAAGAIIVGLGGGIYGGLEGSMKIYQFQNGARAPIKESSAIKGTP